QEHLRGAVWREDDVVQGEQPEQGEAQGVRERRQPARRHPAARSQRDRAALRRRRDVLGGDFRPGRDQAHHRYELHRQVAGAVSRGGGGKTMTAKAWLLTAVAAVGQIAVARAQVSPADQACISALNGGVREVAKQHGKIVGRCLRSFASGSLPTTVEACVITDVGGRIQRANDKAVASTTAACTGATPAFGVSPLGPALARGALGEIDLMHGSLGIDLDGALIPTALAAGCQARVAGALLKCADVRRKTFTKCQTAGLRAGTIVDAATLESSCLGTGNSTQPDSSGAVGKVCGLKVARMVARCTGVDLA